MLYLKMEFLKDITIPSIIFLYFIYIIEIRRRTPGKVNDNSAIFSIITCVFYGLAYIAIWGYGRYYLYVYLSIEEKHSYIFNVVFALILIAVWEFSRFVEMRLRNKIRARYNKQLQKTQSPRRS